MCETLRTSYRCHMAEMLTPSQAQAGAPGWRYVDGQLVLTVRFPDFATGLAFVNAVGAVAEEQNHHPDIDLRWGTVVLTISSHDVGGLTPRDLTFTAAVDPLVGEHGGSVEA